MLLATTKKEMENGKVDISPLGKVLDIGLECENCFNPPHKLKYVKLQLKEFLHPGFQDVLEVLPKEQYNWFKSLDKNRKELFKQILSDEFKYDRKVVREKSKTSTMRCSLPHPT